LAIELPERVGVLIVRVWREIDPGDFRARIIQSVDVTHPELNITTAAATAEDVYAAVRSWLESFTRG
jgi:hypothetical protein